MKDPFEQAVKEHGETVFRVCRAVLGPSPDAEDAWSETFLAALRAWPDLSNDTNIEAWLVRVAQRKTIDILRARARHATPAEDLPEQRSPLGIPMKTSMESGRLLQLSRSANASPSPTTTSEGSHMRRQQR